RAGEVQDWHDEPRLQHPPAGSARADGSCTRLSALTGGLRVPSCKGPRGRRPGVKTVPDRGLTSAQTLQPLAQLRQKSPKASIVRGSRESIGIDSLLGGWAMPKAYSGEMRERVIAEVESGASRREAAEEFAVSASTAVIWVKCFRQTGRCAAQPRGGSISPLEKHESGSWPSRGCPDVRMTGRNGQRILTSRAKSIPSIAPGSRISAKIMATSRPRISIVARAASALSHSMVS